MNLLKTFFTRLVFFLVLCLVLPSPCMLYSQEVTLTAEESEEVLKLVNELEQSLTLRETQLTEKEIILNQKEQELMQRETALNQINSGFQEYETLLKTQEKEAMKRQIKVGCITFSCGVGLGLLLGMILN